MMKTLLLYYDDFIFHYIVDIFVLFSFFNRDVVSLFFFFFKDI